MTSQSFALLLSGFSNTASAFGALPLGLGGFGMPGCSGRVSPEVVQALGGASNVATFALAVPNQPSLIGVTIYQQALVPDPAVANAAGMVVSDAVRAVVGY